MNAVAKLIIGALAVGALLTEAGRARAGQVDDVVARRQALRAEIDRITAELGRRVPADAVVRDSAGNVVGVNKDHPGYKKVQAEWEAQVAQARARHDVNDTRFDDLLAACKEAGVEEGIRNTGSKPRSINSDIDLTELNPGDGRKLAETLSSRKYTVQEYPDRWVVKETDTTIWKKVPDEAVGTSAHQARAARDACAEDIFSTPGGKYKTSGGEVGVLDPEGAVLANAKKASEAGLTRDPAVHLGDIDGHTIGKSVSKAAEWTGTKGNAPEFFRQADALRGHKTWEEAGVCDIGDPPDVKARKVRDWLNKAQEHLGRAAEVGAAQSQELETIRRKTAKSYDRQGLKEEALRVRREQVEVRVANEETRRFLAETDPLTAGRLSGQSLRPNPDGTFTDVVSGETLTHSQVRQRATAQARARTVEATRHGPSGEPGAAISRTARVGGWALAGYGAMDSALRGARRAAEEARPEDWYLKTYAKGWAYGVWYVTGIPDAMDVGASAGDESLEQYRRDLLAGRNPSAAWMAVRAGFWGGWNMLRAMSIDPLIAGGTAVREGLGVLSDKAAEERAAADAEEMIQRVKEGRAVQAGKAPPDWSALPAAPPAGAGAAEMQRWYRQASAQLDAMWETDPARQANRDACLSGAGKPRSMSCERCGFSGLHWWFDDRWSCPNCEQCTMPLDRKRGDGLTYRQFAAERQKLYEQKRQELLRRLQGLSASGR